MIASLLQITFIWRAFSYVPVLNLLESYIKCYHAILYQLAAANSPVEAGQTVAVL